MAIILDGSTGITVNKVAFDNSGVAGSASTPSIYPAGDTNTGFFFPAADTFAAATSGTERLRIDSSGNVKFAGSISVGNATPAASGAGITFPATQSASSDANTLDDYEEGTWTPNVIHSGSNNSTWTTKNGYYTKVGRLVTAWFVCDGGTSGTAGTNLQVTGLPFALGTISGAITFGIWSTNGTVRTGGLNISSSGTTTMNMYNGGSPIIEQQSYASGCITYFA